MTSVFGKSGPEIREIPPDTTTGNARDHRGNCVVLDVRVWDGRKVHGWKEHVYRSVWETADASTREALINSVTRRLTTALESERT